MRFIESLPSSRPCALAAAAVTALLLGFTATAQAGIIPIGSSLSFGGTNLPGACTDTTCQTATTFGPASVFIDGGALTLHETQVADGPDAEWDEWSISTVGGGPVAGDINAFWELTMSYDLSAPVIFDQVVDQWTVNGTPVSPLTNGIGSICCATASNPSPASGEAYYNSGFSGPLPAGVESGWNQIFVSPYNFVAAGGVDPSTANGFNFALHFTLQAAPEPGSLVLLAAALAAVPFLLRRRAVR